MLWHALLKLYPAKDMHKKNRRRKMNEITGMAEIREIWMLACVNKFHIQWFNG